MNFLSSCICSCPECGKRFAFKHRLEEHARVHEPWDASKMPECELCGRHFRHKHSLKSHIQKVHVDLQI